MKELLGDLAFDAFIAFVLGAVAFLAIIGAALLDAGCTPPPCVDDVHMFASALCEPDEPWEKCFARLHAADNFKSGGTPR